MKETSFPKERILTISASDYFLISGKKPTDFRTVGVHVNGAEYGASYPTTNCPFIDIFRKHVPEGTEVVVAYNSSAGGTVDEPDGFTVYLGQGTALIPREKEGRLASKLK